MLVELVCWGREGRSEIFYVVQYWWMREGGTEREREEEKVEEKFNMAVTLLPI